MNNKLIIFPLKENESASEFCRQFVEDNGLHKFILGRNEVSSELIKQINVDGFIDDYCEDRYFEGKQVFKTGQIPKESMVLTSSSLRPITAGKNLEILGVKHLDHFMFCRYSGLGLKDEFLRKCKKDIEDKFDKYEEVYNLLSDGESKETFSNIVNFRYSDDIGYLRKFRYDIINQYFEEFLDFRDGEVFADIGGYDGGTTVEFIKRCPNYKSVHLFEPDPKNFENSKIVLKQFDSIFFYQKGLSSKKGIFKMASGMGSSSKISDNGDIDIEIGTLDETVKEQITFIKMDIEGEEIPALQGSKNHIINDFPKLAISCYHKPDDLWKIPELVLSLRKDYKIYIRHYTEGLHETVIFFIPK